MRDNRTLLLLLLSIGLIGTWAYHFYDKGQYSSAINKKVQAPDTLAIIEAFKDSLNRMKTASANSPSDGNENIDSLRHQLESRMKEINNLKKKASEILKNKNLSQEDLKHARALIRNLRMNIEEMKQQNTSLEDERMTLSKELAQLNLDIDSLQQNILKLGTENRQLAAAINDASIFMASEIKLSAVKAGANETPTNSARKADKLIVSFNVQNNVRSYPNAELVIVILDPSGNVIMDDLWQSRTFDTKAEGEKKFTRKIRFDYIKGESKNLLFSITPEDMFKGTYQLQIYHNGVKVGQTTLGLT